MFLFLGSRYWDDSDELSLLVVSRPQAPSILQHLPASASEASAAAKVAN